MFWIRQVECVTLHNCRKEILLHTIVYLLFNNLPTAWQCNAFKILCLFKMMSILLRALLSIYFPLYVNIDVCSLKACATHTDHVFLDTFPALLIHVSLTDFFYQNYNNNNNYYYYYLFVSPKLNRWISKGKNIWKLKLLTTN